MFGKVRLKYWKVRIRDMGRSDKLNKSMDTLFPQVSKDSCRVCNEDVVDGRWSYCSERCREIATGVQKMFLWTVVREQILERDDHSCQKCGRSTDVTLHVDHITRIADGGHPLDETNLQTLCEDCHKEKTADENASRNPAPDITLEDYIEL